VFGADEKISTPNSFTGDNDHAMARNITNRTTTIQKITQGFHAPGMFFVDSKYNRTI
jgi:hypothetical protein